jgi:hypothetical protein
MDSLNFNILLERENLVKEIKDILINFEKNKNNLSIKRGIYIYGAPGSGKTQFIHNLLTELNYDIINYDAGDIRNKSIIDTITENNMTNINVLSLFKKKKKPIAIIMDEIDGMNNGDKGGINSLIKIIRPKKTRKQKLEEVAYVPIICIGNYHIDKKINELIKVCHTFQFLSPSNPQIINIIKLIMPKIICDKKLLNNIVNYIQNDLRKILLINQIYKTNYNILNNIVTSNIFQTKSFNEDTKEITKKLINSKYSLNHHNILMNETDRTIVGLLWHENIIEILNKINRKNGVILYLKLLNNICIADYIDRITFQKQIWQFNEMSSLIKILYNNFIFHNNIDHKFSLQNIRFTKVLTKYSTEYNNYLFIQNLCQILNLDKKDLFSFFIKIKDLHISGEIFSLFETYDLTKLDINRIYRYINKYIYTENYDDESDIFE